MQGLFGWMGGKNPNRSSGVPANPRRSSQVSRSEFRDDRNGTEPELEFPRADRFDDEEETNWDDAETLIDEDNPWTQPRPERLVYTQPIVPVVAPLTPPTIPDLEDWDEALPAATVKNNNIQEVRRSKKNSVPELAAEDVWDDNLPSRAFLPTGGSEIGRPPQQLHQQAQPSSVDTPLQHPTGNERLRHSAIGIWANTLQQLRRVLPAPMRQISDLILTAIVVLLVTVGIWFVDGFFVPESDPAVANLPTSVITTQPNSNAVIGSPEQTFIDAIQRQIGDVTSQYPDEMIQNIDVNRDRLIVRLNPSWYLMSDDRQNLVTSQMWLQAKANHLSKLEVQDSQGNSIARSPVVGREMIILQRRQL